MKPALAPKIEYPGAVVVCSGRYRIRHSTQHFPATETFLAAGLILPPCNGCRVTYTMVERISHEDYVREDSKLRVREARCMIWRECPKPKR